MHTVPAFERPRYKGKQHPQDRALERELRDVARAIERGAVQPHHTAKLFTNLTGPRRRDAAKLILALPDRHFTSVMDRVTQRPKVSSVLEFALLKRAAQLGALHWHLAMDSLAFAAGQRDPETFSRVFETARSYRDAHPQLYIILKFDEFLLTMIEICLDAQTAEIVAGHLEEQPEDLNRAFFHLRRKGRLKHSLKPVIALFILKGDDFGELLQQQLAAAYREHDHWAHLFDDSRHAELARYKLTRQFTLREMLTTPLRDIRKVISV